MFDFIFYDQRFRTFLHYAYFPTVAVASFAFVSWFLQVDTSVEGYDRPAEITSVQSVSESANKSEGPPATAQEVREQAMERLKQRKKREALKAQKRREIADCERRNDEGMQKYARSNNAKNWRDWAAIDKECRSLRGE